MTVSNTNLRNDYEGNGTQTVFAFTFKVLNEVNQETGKDFTIKVIITDSLGVETEQTEDVDYTVTLNEEGTGNITFTTAPLLTDSITFLSDIPRTQNTDYINIGTDKFPADSHEGTVDKLTLIAQEQDEAISRAVLLPESSQLTGLTIPVSVENADKAIVVNSAGDDLDAKNLADIGTAPVTDFAKTLLDDETAAEARTTLEVKASVDTWSNLGTTSGAADTYTTASPTVSGVRYIIKINIDNTGASTLNGTAMEKFDGAGALVALEAGDLQQDQNYDILDKGTSIVVLNPQLPYITSTNFTVTNPTIQKFTSGSGTYTTPAGVRYINVIMVGGGGGGAGSGIGAAGGQNGGSGGNTTFGSSLLEANGGTSAFTGGAGGSASLGTGPIGTALSGGDGVGYSEVATTGHYLAGENGGSSVFTYGRGGTANSPAPTALANSGAGGGGGGGGSAVGMRTGGGGGAGGYINAIITSPAASYSYAVGAAGTAGTAGTSGTNGGAGGSGYIEVREYY